MCDWHLHLTEDQCESYFEEKAQRRTISNRYEIVERDLPYGCIWNKDDSGSVVIQFNSNPLKYGIPCGRDGATCICLKEGM